MKTFSAKPTDVEQKWYVIDAEGIVLGRLASHVARLVRGKHKPMFTPHTDCGDKIIIINADKIAVTGRKLEQNRFYWHTGYPGGIKERSWKQILEGRFPERLVENAVRRMLPKESPLALKQFRHNLYVYAGAEHPHQAQQPEVIDAAALHRKMKVAA